MNPSRRMFILRLALGATVLPMSACGSILYPERRGLKGGRIDPGVAVLDGLGLLLFLIPGVIAFAVDFHTGAIYLPGTYSQADGEGELAELPFDEPLTDAKLDEIWESHYREARPFRNEEAVSLPLGSVADLPLLVRRA